MTKYENNKEIVSHAHIVKMTPGKTSLNLTFRYGIKIYSTENTEAIVISGTNTRMRFQTNSNESEILKSSKN